MKIAGRTFRLTDILTKEVSLVDHAANKRVFLIRKNDGSSDRELVSDGKGGFKTAKAEGDPAEPPKPEDPPKPAEEPKPEDPKPPADPEPEPEPPAPAEKLSLSTRTFESIVKVVEQLTALTQKAGVRDAAADEGPVEEALLAAIAPIASAEERTPLREETFKSAAALQKELKSASMKLLEVADSLAIDTSDKPPPSEVRWRISDVLDNLVEFTRFEVAQAAMAKAEEATGFRSLAVGLMKALGHELEAKPPEFDEAHAVRLVSAAADTVKMLRLQIKKQDARIRELESEPQPSRRLAPERERETGGASEDVSWPYDMNAKKYPGEDLSF